MKLKVPHALQWIAEPLEEHETFLQKKMFGGELLCLHGRQMLFLIAKEEPWNGMLVCTSREFHESLMKEFPALEPHEILGKWLYVSQSNPRFEAIAAEIAGHALHADLRIGIDPKPKKKRKAKKSARKK